MHIIQLAILFLVVTFLGSNAADSPCTCLRNDYCALIPPSTTATWPCYQGLIKDAIKCFETDPLLKAGTTWACGNCSDYGFPNYSGKNDPIYINMELWNK